MAYTTIKKPSDYFNTKLYTGNGGTQSITGVGFQPDMVWGKDRGNVTNHELHDAVRGATRRIKPNDTDAGQEQANSITAFNADGFSLGSDGDLNGNGNNIVSWNWLANGAGSANTAGDLNSTVSANTTAGFSIVTYSGTGNFGESVGHGLGVAPSMIIARRLNGVEDWAVYHQTLGASKYIILNTTGTEQSSTSRWGGVAPTNSVFTVGNHASVNVGSGTHVAYCFAEKQGYSKFGSYTGNGNADGSFIYTGFKPAFTIIKRTDIADNWVMDDGTRSPLNLMQNTLYSNLSNAEYTSTAYGIDYLSNGFKIRTIDGNYNNTGGSYIYMAFAEQPLVGDNPATAR